MPSNFPAARPSAGIGYDSTIGWYAWFGQSANTGVRVPFKMTAKPLKIAGNALKTAGRTMAANPLWVIAFLAGAAVAVAVERPARQKAEARQKFESARADVAEKDRDEAQFRAEEMQTQIDLGFAPAPKPTEDQAREIRALFGIDSNDRNIAVCGRVSVGKSAFVNSIRGLSPTHPDAAPVGNEETTTEMMGYRDPHLPNIVWWDIPGSAGQTSRDQVYFSRHILFAFDQIILVHEQVFSTTELIIYHQCQDHDKEVLIVRTQSDNNLRRINEDNDDDNDREPADLVHQYVSQSSGATQAVLQANGLPVPPRLFHITSRLLRHERDRSYSVRSSQCIQPIDEGPLLKELGIHPLQQEQTLGERPEPGSA
ncbi:interferon-inducible GTPase-domain-containing protein [Aspergillus heterothallicus]